MTKSVHTQFRGRERELCCVLVLTQSSTLSATVARQPPLRYRFQCNVTRYDVSIRIVSTASRSIRRELRGLHGCRFFSETL